MFNKENAAKIILFASLGVMSFVLLITSSIWMHPMANGAGPVYDKAATSVAFVVLGIIAISVAGYLTFKDGFSKTVLITLAIAFVLLLISAAVPMDNQKSVYEPWRSMGSPSAGIPTSMLNALRVFPVALTFLLVPGIAFLGSSYMVAKEENLF